MEIPSSRIARVATLYLVLAAPLLADRISPKAQPSDYPAHTKTGRVEIAADYLVHSVLGAGHDEMLFARDYLVVEVAFYPEAGASYQVDTAKFTLRLNGKKDVLFPQVPGVVAYSMKHPESSTHPHLEAAAGLGDVTLGVGRPVPAPRFPNDTTGAPNPQRLPPQAPESTDRQNVPKTRPTTVEEVIQQTALENGEQHAAIAGYVFFAYQGNVKKIKSIELVYSDPAGISTLRLQ